MFSGLFSSMVPATRAEKQLTRLCKKIDPKASLNDQLLALRRVVSWIDRPGPVEAPVDRNTSGQVIHSRLDFLFYFLDHHPDARQVVAHALRQALSQSRAFNLFCLAGLPSEASLTGEFVDRALSRFLPKVPDEKDLRDLLTILFPSEKSQAWLSSITSVTVAKLHQLLDDESMKSTFEHLRSDACDAALYLVAQIQILGLDPNFQQRTIEGGFRDSPFYQLTVQTRKLTDALLAGNGVEAQGLQRQFTQTVALCRQELGVVHKHLSIHGVSVALVYNMDRISALLVRVEEIFSILLAPANSRALSDFFVKIVDDLVGRRKIASLFSNAFSLLSKKIAEQNAETGDHYIARSRRAHFRMLLGAMGGGVVTAFTALFKLLSELWNVAYFVKGFAASVNYAASFVVIQLCGFTLGTKQPAMTAHVLAEKMKSVADSQALEDLISEILCLIRSQSISVFGNVISVVPCVVAVDYYFSVVGGHHVLSPEAMEHVFHEHSILGISLLAAAWTGVLLWLSSIIAGWVDNWSRYRRIHLAIGEHRGLRSFFGKTLTAKVGAFYARNISGFAGNISLGFLLGMAPKIAAFLGLPLEVRHITLSTGSVAYAMAAGGTSNLQNPHFWLAILGLVAIGIINISVSFGLALLVAMRARQVRTIERRQIFRKLFQTVRRQPSLLMMPPKDSPISNLH